jgi:hypothetical protein
MIPAKITKFDLVKLDGWLRMLEALLLFSDLPFEVFSEHKQSQLEIYRPFIAAPLGNKGK